VSQTFSPKSCREGKSELELTALLWRQEHSLSNTLHGDGDKHQCERRFDAPILFGVSFALSVGRS
jgi:hypothetical protein